MENESILVDGLFSYDIPDTAPDFVLGRQAFNISKFRKWLEENEKYAVRGFLTIEILRSRAGSRYAKLDLYDYNKQKATTGTTGQDLSGYEKWQASMDKALPVIQQDGPDEPIVDVSDVPF